MCDLLPEPVPWARRAFFCTQTMERVGSGLDYIYTSASNSQPKFCVFLLALCKVAA
uniref:Uncharacterized protein n=1 Tax=Anguilla anguilla TaxID=7936 RepID=A0A0E9TQ97_ANGAN